MNSLRTKFLSLGLALVMALTATGCAIRTPATVGHIGSVEIPAGIYLLAQYEAYSTAAGDADLATGETADDVAAVLKAECTGEIGGEQVTTDGADYVARLTLRNLQYYRRGRSQVRRTRRHAFELFHLRSRRAGRGAL